MGVGKGSSPPPPLNTAAMTQQQTQSNVQTAIANALLNQTNQITPTGTLSYRQIGSTNVNGNDIPQFEATTALSPQQQALLEKTGNLGIASADIAARRLGDAEGATAAPFSYAGMPSAPVAPTAPNLPNVPTAGAIPAFDEAYRTQVRDQIIARNQPQVDRDREALITRLANQGINVNTSDAATGAFDKFNRGVNDFRLGADISAGDEAARRFALQLQGQGQDFGQKAQIFGMGMDKAQSEFGNQGAIFGMQGQARDRAVNDALRLRWEPIQETQAFLGSTTGPSGPTFVNTPQSTVQPTDTMGPQLANYQARMQQYQNSQAANQALLGSIFGTLGTLGGAYLLGPGGLAFGGGRAAAQDGLVNLARSRI